MRRPLLVCLAALLPADSIAHHLSNWPDPAIPVPPLVQAFILAECQEAEGIHLQAYVEETLASCVTAEEYGYRAVVTMLIDNETGDQAAEHYRGCRVGLGTQGGRFYRRRAECMGGPLDIVWRLEFMRRADALAPPLPIDFAATTP